VSLLVVGLGVLLLSVPALTAYSRLGPAARVRAACVSALAGIWVLGAGTMLTALPLVMVWHDGEEATGFGLTHLSPGGPMAWAAGGALGGLGVAWVLTTLGHAFWARRRAALPRWAAESAAHDEGAGAEVRIAPSLRPMAFAVPGRDRHVVISRAVTRVLTEPELRAVLAHEGAHLRLRHDRYLLILATYERVWGWLPGVAGVVARLRQAVEQWADTAASDQPIDPDALRAARRSLASGPSCVHPIEFPSPDDTSVAHVGALAVTAIALVTAGGYLATHVVGDLAAVLAVLH